MKIKLCKKNASVNTLKRKLSQVFPHDKIVIKKCIHKCNACETKPIARIKGNTLKAKNRLSLIKKIKQKY